MFRVNRARRMFLCTGAGAWVGIPFLPSLAPTAAAAPTPRPRLVLASRSQGGFLNFKMHPMGGEVVPFLPGHDIRRMALRAANEDGRAVVTRIIQADASVLTPQMLSKVNVLRGFDLTSGSAHNQCEFGNTQDRSLPPVPSIDQLAAWSPSFYRAGELNQRSIHVGSGGDSSFFHANPSTRSGSVERLRNQVVDPAQVWARLFGGFMPPAPKDAPAPVSRKPLVDHLLTAYKGVRNSDRRLAAADRARLDSHMDLLLEIQRKANAGSNITGTCKVPAAAAKVETPRRPGDSAGSLRSPEQSRQLYGIYNDLIAAAFVCGVTRIATITAGDLYDTFSSFTGDWHGAAHNADNDPAMGEVHAGAHQRYFEYVMLDLARKLDVEEVPGQTYLDNTLIVFSSEASGISHRQADKPIITVGNLGGYFKTGMFVDYRNVRPESLVERKKGHEGYAGILLHQFWANLLFALGIPRTEWDHYADEAGRGKGYGKQFLGAFDGHKFDASQYVAGVREKAGDKLPIITV